MDYDPAAISLTALLEKYFMVIDPLSVNQQGHDRGIQYRTGIYYTDEAQLPTVRRVFDREQEKAGAPLAVAVEPIKNFFPIFQPAMMNSGIFITAETIPTVVSVLACTLVIQTMEQAYTTWCLKS